MKFIQGRSGSACDADIQQLRRLAELDAEMARLAALRAEMVAMIDGLPTARRCRRASRKP
jgi:hypothetical protein